MRLLSTPALTGAALLASVAAGRPSKAVAQAPTDNNEIALDTRADEDRPMLQMRSGAGFGTDGFFTTFGFNYNVRPEELDLGGNSSMSLFVDPSARVSIDMPREGPPTRLRVSAPSLDVGMRGRRGGMAALLGVAPELVAYPSHQSYVVRGIQYLAIDVHFQNDTSAWSASVHPGIGGGVVLDDASVAFMVRAEGHYALAFALGVFDLGMSFESSRLPSREGTASTREGVASASVRQIGGSPAFVALEGRLTQLKRRAVDDNVVMGTATLSVGFDLATTKPVY